MQGRQWLKIATITPAVGRLRDALGSPPPAPSGRAVRSQPGLRPQAPAKGIFQMSSRDYRQFRGETPQNWRKNLNGNLMASPCSSPIISGAHGIQLLRRGSKRL